LIRSARSSSSSLATAWIVAAIGIASRAPIRPTPKRRPEVGTTRCQVRNERGQTPIVAFVMFVT